VAIIALAALPLLLLLTWYRVGIDVSGSLGGLIPVHPPSKDFSGWQAFTSTDVAITVVADLVVLALALSFPTGSRLALVLATAGSLALVLMLAIAATSPPDIVGERLNELLPIDVPPLRIPQNGVLDAGIQTTTKPGVWIGLVAAAVAFAGCAVALLAGAGPATRRCPDCAKLVSAQARVCRFCGHRFDEAFTRSQRA
jgi:Uncharacterised protein family UPF0547